MSSNLEISSPVIFFVKFYGFQNCLFGHFGIITRASEAKSTSASYYFSCFVCKRGDLFCSQII